EANASAGPGADARVSRALAAAPQAAPLPQALGLRPEQLSASAYDDLRRCPYRFFALRLMALREADEVETEIGKRDFGTWLHKVLKTFHEALRDGGEPAAGRAALIDRIAREGVEALRVPSGEFLPFEAGWPGVRDAYLAWLADHEAAGATFA